MISLSNLNESQRLAASTIDGPVLILAGAGSGKTRTITYRMTYMIANLKINPSNILGVTFTNKAAKEMKERVHTLIGKHKMRGITLSTFHALGVKILRQEIKHLGYSKEFSIYDSADQSSIVRESLRNFKADKSFDRKIVLSKIGFLKNSGIAPEEFTKSAFFDPENPYDQATESAYHFYQDKLKFYNAIDFDDILFLTVKLFDENPDIAKKYSEKFKYIMVDEYQDTNPLQFKLVLHLTSTHQNLCVVGDDDQSIYAFRGADIQNILQFEKYFKSAKVIKLEENYRSTAPILNLANKVIKENKTRKDKTMKATIHEGMKPILWATGDTDHEAAVICDEIIKFQSDGKHLADICVLFRSNTQLPPIEDQLRLNQVPYNVVGGQKFYEKKEIKDLIAYLCAINNPKDELSLRRILNIPHRGIGTQTLHKFLENAETKKISLFDSLHDAESLGIKNPEVPHFLKIITDFKTKFKTNLLENVITELITEISFIQFIADSYDATNQISRRKKDVEHFIESARRFTQYFKEKASLNEFIERILLSDNQDDENKLDDDDIRKNEVTLMTLHSSKGLEFDVVFLMGMEEELLPHKKTIVETIDDSEERRLCYVGMTRAKERLFMTYAKQRKLYGKDTPRFKSRFVASLIGELITEQDRTVFGHLSPEEAKVYKDNFFKNLIDSLDE